MTVNPSINANSAIGRVKRGDQAAFAEFYDLLAPKVFGTVKRVLRDRAMSEEVTQEIFVELWRTAERFDETRGSATTWALTIARRRAVDRVRSEQSRRDRIEEFAAQPGHDDAGPAEMVLAAIESDVVNRALTSLPDEQRQVIEMSFFEGCAHAEIAARLDLPLGTVKGRARGGLKRLRGEIAGTG